MQVKRRSSIGMVALSAALAAAACGGTDTVSVESVTPAAPSVTEPTTTPAPSVTEATTIFSTATSSTTTSSMTPSSMARRNTTISSLATPTTTAPSTTAPVEPELVDLVGGGQLDLTSIEGTDTVLWFWAPW